MKHFFLGQLKLKSRLFFWTCALMATLGAATAAAQTAVRCDVNGKAVYSDQPCLPGLANKAVINTQETPEQRAAASAANDQIRKDNAAVDKRLDDRYKRETAGASKVSIKSGSNEIAVATKSKAGKDKASNSKKTKATKKAKKAGKSTKAKRDSKSYRSKA